MKEEVRSPKSEVRSPGIDPQEALTVRLIRQVRESLHHYAPLHWFVVDEHLALDYRKESAGEWLVARRYLNEPMVRFRTKRAAAAYCLQLISEHLGIAQLCLPNCIPLPKLPMRRRHCMQILGDLPPIKTTTWRTQPHCGRYVLRNSQGQAELAIVTLAYRGEVWWPRLRRDEDLLIQKFTAEGYEELVWFKHAINTIYRSIAADFFAGRRPFHEHEIVKVEKF